MRADRKVCNWAVVVGVFGVGLALLAEGVAVTRVAEVPLWGNFYSVQRSGDPPLPFDPFPELPLYAVGTNTYYFDDRAVDYVALRQQREAWLGFRRAAAESLGAKGFTVETLEDEEGPPMPPGFGGGGGTNEPPDVGPPLFLSSTGLCLYPPAFASSNLVSLTVTNGTAQARYDVFLTTNLAVLALPALSLTNWVWLGRGAAGQTNFLVSDPPMPEGWFRLGTLQDSDGDGLTDAFEGLVSHTAVGGWSNPDTDADGLPDGWEVEQGLQPSVADGSADPDGDGLTNWGEWLAGSDARVAATWGVWVSSPAAGSLIP